MDFACMGVDAIQVGLRAGDFSATEVAQSSLDRIERIDGAVNAFLEVTPELALAKAAEVDKAIAEGSFDQMGPLAGVPVAFKDNMNQIGTHTTCASRMLENYVSPYTATCVQKVIDAGGLPLGKLNMDEFAFGSTTETSAFGTTKNPWGLDRVPGGSSGGSAAAVAAGLATVTLGSDTGGSIRQPASFCGVVGVKPTYGAVSRYGVVAFGSSLDQVGPFARNVRDAALTLNALCGRDPLDCTSQACDFDFTANLDQGVEGMKVGIVPAFLDAEGLDREVRNAVMGAADKLASLGAEIVEIELPNAQAAISAYYVLAPCEAFSNLSRFDSVRYGYCDPGHKDLGGQYEASRAQGFGVEARRRIMLGSYLLSSGVYDKYYYPAQQIRTLITQDYLNAYQKVDVILSPIAPSVAWKFGAVSDPTSMYLADMFTISINIAGNGGMNLPVGLGEDSGMPVGVQLIAPPFKDANMLRAAAALEREYQCVGVAPDFAGEAAVKGGE
ncbi:MAG: Asp-tRNA(Asn)/Glu-tRNA(Gln) amidotransferase subunit GatA [Coriobacteriaceae bacterium]|nr:Asp-tRNA(Asn)/Glu-tRNA(Gln) amidotransferase subunit GatA [Coriobacteriaceae bacterium]MDO4498123.1 Asp-tRNA(Asn)/Glu-tRNA(Gln) amidotransferase subunit GatA [Coriobacteriaceae bacterium]MDY3799352.1 Asp-tRNA(Asn)/Glu-tRNA(Gln) amidotransferase subunit GatA [Eggerthellaceae bacterium]MDY5370998.1 Asp-tRNA(Asn)/Glu-tRNA(Gln) amidotransferase subunit GatA [Eggerthellaceae bacterium]